MKETKRSCRVAVSFEDELAVRQASESNESQRNRRAMNRVVRSLRSVSNKGYFRARIGTVIRQLVHGFSCASIELRMYLGDC